MRLLLDTHTLVWWIRASPLLSEPAREAIAQESSAVSVSVASAWEIAIKVGQGRWPEARELLESFEYATAEEGFHILPIAVSHVRTAGLLQSPHRDPFDRLLTAQARIEGLTLVTADARITSFGAAVLW